MIQALQLGRVPYGEALRLQEELVEKRKKHAIGDVLLLLEHPAVITLGRNASERNILLSREELAKRGVEVFEINRGGDVTYHGLGQLVGYPIFDLRGLPGGDGKHKTLYPVEFMRKLEEVIIRTCAEYGVVTQRVQCLTGVWTRPMEGVTKEMTSAKLCAMGIHISRGVTSHGFALNVTTNLDEFKLIVPCGIAGKPVTSLNHAMADVFRTRTVKPLTTEEVAPAVALNFGAVFGREIEFIQSIDQIRPPLPQDTPATAPEELRQLREEDIHLA